MASFHSVSTHVLNKKLRNLIAQALAHQCIAVPEIY